MGIFLEVIGVVLAFAYACVKDVPIDILYVAGIFVLAGAIIHWFAIYLFVY